MGTFKIGGLKRNNNNGKSKKSQKEYGRNVFVSGKRGKLQSATTFLLLIARKLIFSFIN